MRSPWGFLFALLNGLGGVRLARRLLLEVPRMFLLDVFAAEEVGTCVVYWLRHAG